MLSKFKVEHDQVSVHKFTDNLAAIARIDRMGQTRPTEGSFIMFALAYFC
jgi:hypothetical protein